MANENNQANVDVYFDEFYIVHQKNTASLQVTQATDYYPFGLPFNQYHSDRLYAVSTDAANPQNNKYSTTLRNRAMFQGKEFEKDLDLNWYDFEARMYEPALGRFNSVDPLAEKFVSHSPYNFTLNNPVYFVDPDGRAPNPAYDVTWPFHYAATQVNKHYQKLAYQAGQIATGVHAFQQQLWAPTLNQWSQDMRHRAGNYNPYQSYAEQYASGRHGTFLQVASYVGGAIPIVGGVAHGLIDARERNYGSAALNLGAGLTELGAFSSFLRTASQISTASEIQHLAFGLNRTPFGSLEDFGQAIGAKTYRQFTSGGLKPNEILAAMEDTNNWLHFNLSGFSTRGALQKGALGPYEVRNVTNWEYFQINSIPGALQRTTFYRFEQGIYVPTFHIPKW